MNINFLKYNPIAFKQNNPQPKELHGYRNISHLHCAICGNEMMEKYKRDELLSQLISDIDEPLKSAESIKIFRQTVPFLPPEETKIIKIMEGYSKKYPDKTFQEIFLIPEVKDFHAQKANEKQDAYQESCKNIFKNIEELLPDLNNEEQMNFDFFKMHIMSIGSCRKPNELKKYMLNDEVDKFAEKMQIQDTDLVKQIKDLTSQTPLVPTDADRLICYFEGKKDSAILQSLLRNHLITIRHLDSEPKTDPYQMFCLCERCNTNTGNIPFPELFKIFKTLPENMKRYSIDIISHIVRGDISLPKDYPRRFQQIVNLYAEPKIVLPSLARVVGEKTSVSKVLITPEKKREFLRKYPQIKSILEKRETYVEQNVRIIKLKERLKEMCTSRDSNEAQINNYRFYIKLLEEKLKETAESYHRN